MANSFVTYTASGSRYFNIPFPYLRPEHIEVSINGESFSGFRFLNSSTLYFTPLPSPGSEVIIRRVTQATPLVDFENTSTLTEEDLDTALLQALYLGEEARDFSNSIFLVGTDFVDFGNRRLTGLRSPTNSDDAITLGYAQANFGDTAAAAQANAAAASAAAAAGSAGAASTSQSEAASSAAAAATSAQQASDDLDAARAFYLAESTPEEFHLRAPERFLSPIGFWNAMDPVGLTDQDEVVLDMDAGVNFTLIIGGNRTLATPINVKTGQRGFITVEQDSTGGHTLAFASAWDFSGGSAPTITSTAGSRSVFEYYAYAQTNVLLIPHLGVA